MVLVQLTGGINFYNTNITIKIIFRKMFKEDGLIIINSKFKIKNIFKVSSDAKLM